MEQFTFILILVPVVILAFVLFALRAKRRIADKLNYMIDALEDKEYNFRFREKRLFDRQLNRSLNRVRGIFEKERGEMREKELYFANMLDHVKTGIIALYSDGRIEFSNNQVLSIMGVASLSNVRQLKHINEQLYNSLLQVEPEQEVKVTLFNESSQVNILLSASYAKIKGCEVKIVALNDISSQLNDNEVESWNKLTRVLTHEVMNSIAPISSLSEMLGKKSLEDDLPQEYIDGLDTISASSRGLMKFVESYRNLTRVAAPVKKVLIVRELAERVINLTLLDAQRNDAAVTYKEKSASGDQGPVCDTALAENEDIILYADEGQITQILINLVKNALQAGATRVEIASELDLHENVIINVSNNGSPISKESRNEIFVPFYTTKQEGTGIGLSLSRQIMRLHGGSITLARSDERGTLFTLLFR